MERKGRETLSHYLSLLCDVSNVTLSITQPKTIPERDETTQLHKKDRMCSSVGRKILDLRPLSRMCWSNSHSSYLSNRLGEGEDGVVVDAAAFPSGIDGDGSFMQSSCGFILICCEVMVRYCNDAVVWTVRYQDTEDTTTSPNPDYHELLDNCNSRNISRSLRGCILWNCSPLQWHLCYDQHPYVNTLCSHIAPNRTHCVFSLLLPLPTFTQPSTTRRPIACPRL